MDSVLMRHNPMLGYIYIESTLLKI